MPNKNAPPNGSQPTRKVFGRSVKVISDRFDEIFEDDESLKEEFCLFSNIKGTVKNLFTGKLPTLSSDGWLHPNTCVH